MDSKQIAEAMRLKLPVRYNGITYQIAEAMRLKLPVRYNGITYQQITEYILWYDAAGTRRTSVSLLDKNSHSITRAPADRVELVAQEGGTDEQHHQRDPAREL